MLILKKATYEEIEQRLIREATKRGFKVGYESGKYRYFISEKDFYFDQNKNDLYVRQKNDAFNMIMKDGVWENCKPYEKETIEETTLRVFEEACKEVEEPKIGDVVKAWCRDKNNFVFGVLIQIDDTHVGFLVGDKWYTKIEKVTEISVNDFKNSLLLSK